MECLAVPLCAAGGVFAILMAFITPMLFAAYVLEKF